MRRTGRQTSTWMPPRTERIRRSRSSLRLRAHSAGGVGWAGSAHRSRALTGSRTSRAGSGVQFFPSKWNAATSNWGHCLVSGDMRPISPAASLPSVFPESGWVTAEPRGPAATPRGSHRRGGVREARGDGRVVDFEVPGTKEVPYVVGAGAQGRVEVRGPGKGREGPRGKRAVRGISATDASQAAVRFVQ